MSRAEKGLPGGIGLGQLGTFLLLALALATALYFQRGSPPLVAVASRSMEPVFTLGDLILVQEVASAEVREGDVIVFSVPRPIQERYSYPPSVVHRVIKVDTSGGGLAFRTKGDNTGEDPFTVLPGDVRGQVREVVPRAGYAILFLQSRQGLVFFLALTIIYLLYTLSGQVERSGRGLRRAVSGVLASEVIVHIEELEQRQERTLVVVGQSLEQFAGAMGEYGRHLASHTAAVQGLAAAAQGLQATVEEQREFLAQLRETLGRLA